MAKAKETDNTALVTAFIAKQEQPLAALLQAVRTTILAADERVAEQIKWNSPAFYYSGAMQPFDPKEYKRDIVVFNIHRKNQLLLVFPTGARLSNSQGILEGSYTDGRRLITIKDLDDFKTKEDALQLVIAEWVATVE